jgi:3-phenylpropionate/trans-cinnamate dioxygenase ferredoxin reductase component
METLKTAPMVIIGAGHCGGRAAQALREAGWTGEIHMVGDEAYAPYERPPLSKDLLTGEKSAKDCALWSEQAMVDLNIVRHTASAMNINPAANSVTLSNKLTLNYTSLLLATGGRVRKLTITGSDLPEVMTLRGLDDAAALAKRLMPGQRLLVVGGGFIGLEVAASARKFGCQVDLLEGAPRLMGRAVPETVAACALALHRARGVRILLGVNPMSIVKVESGLLVSLSDNTSLEVDTVVVGIGIDPAVELAKNAGLKVERGIVVNAALQTSHAGIYAAGDVAEFPSKESGQLIRQETWHNAESQAHTVARNMMGGQEAYTSLPWFWSDQYDHQLQVMGEPALAASPVTRELEDAGLIIFYMDAEQRLVGACGWGPSTRIVKELKLARMLVEKRACIAPDVLKDPQSNLKALAKAVNLPENQTAK